MKRVLRLWAVPLLITAACAVLPAQAAAARTVTAVACGDAFPRSLDWPEFGVGQFSTQSLCDSGGGLVLANEFGVSPGDIQGFSETPPWSARIVALSFRITGGDTSSGVRYGVLPCSSGCAPVYAIGDRAPGDPEVEVTVPFDPGAGDGAAIFAECPADGPACDARPDDPLVVREVRTVLEDTEPPAVTGEIDGHKFADIVGVPPWTNALAIPVAVFVDDPDGVGALAGAVEIGDSLRAAQSWDLGNGCFGLGEVAALQPCPPFGSASGLIDARALTDGTYDVVASGVDAAENVTRAAPVQIGIDRTRPAAPAHLRIALVTPGWPGQKWTSDPRVEVSWDPPPEPDDATRESPIESADVFAREDAAAAGTHHPVVPAGTGLSPLVLGSDGMWQVSVGFFDAAGNAGVDAADRVGVDHDAPAAPSIDDVGLVSGRDLIDGRTVSWTAPPDDPALESGVCGYAVRADGSSTSVPDPASDETVTAPHWRLPANLKDGAAWVHVRAVSCAGVGSVSASAAMEVDGTGPSVQVTGLTDPDAWATHALKAQIVAADSGSAVARVGFAIDGAPAQWADGDHATADIPEGTHTLSVFAEDTAGNASAPQAFVVNSDAASPAATFEPLDPADPARVTARVGDAVSGLASAAIEFRRVDPGATPAEREWSVLGAAEPLDRGTKTELTLDRRLDDAALAAGDYELRVRAVDVAGNSTTAGNFAIRSLRLPLRRAAEISAAVADVDKVCRTSAGKRCASLARCPRRARCRMVEEVRRDTAKSLAVRSWKRPTALVGEAIDPTGNPVAGARVTILAAPAGRDASEVGATVTDALGRYEWRIPGGPSRALTARLAGTQTQLPAEASARRATRTEIEFSPSPRTLRSGRSMILAGRVLHPEWLPVGGVTVTFQYRTPFGYWTFGTDAVTDAKGRFSLTQPWARRSARSTARLRAHVGQPPSGWPFEPGSSDPVDVTILPAR